ncbi:hypothetical protein CDAR_308701 [Caerostris darwini]|uniref:Uncharacterized protein n=1 Tax=Caerostris darwini TaxID=1538125 RepID=A0AAV4NWA1_9ARAC|nr:hypothetical protein CDAR_308701 [Caerostris darwini]
MAETVMDSSIAARSVFYLPDMHTGLRTTPFLTTPFLQVLPENVQTAWVIMSPIGGVARSYRKKNWTKRYASPSNNQQTQSKKEHLNHNEETFQTITSHSGDWFTQKT